VINLPAVSSGYSELYCRSGARFGASRKSGGAERWADVAENGEAGAERGAGGRGAGKERGAEKERGAGVTEIGWSVERLFAAHAPLTCFGL